MEEFELLFKNFSRFIELTESEKIVITNYFEYQEFKKKTILLKEGTVSQGTWFVCSGVLRNYRIDNNGVEHISQFAPTDWWIADLYSNVSKKPSFNTIDAVEDTTALYIKIKDFEQLLLEVPKLERYFRISLEKNLVSMHERLLDGMILSAQDRYIKFCEKYPSLINTLAQKQIASYIGVTPEFLSKMRSNYLRGK